MSLEWKTDKIVSQTENTVYAYIANIDIFGVQTIKLAGIR